jgi:hypothetical protein
MEDEGNDIIPKNPDRRGATTRGGVETRFFERGFVL